MSSMLSGATLKVFFDANAAKYKAAWAGMAVQSDGYLPSVLLNVLLCLPNSAANPAGQGSVSKPFTVHQLMGAVTNADASGPANVYAMTKEPFWATMLPALQANDLVSCNDWLTICQANALLTAAESAAVQALFNATMPDPNWQPTIRTPCDLQANFVDALGNAYDRMEDYRNADGTFVARYPVQFINTALGRS